MHVFMVTNGGPHPPDAWARATAAQIANLIQVDEASTSPEAIQARMAKPRFELDLADALLDHHGNVQEVERSAIEQHGSARLSHPYDPSGHLDDALSAVVATANGTPFAAHFALKEVQAVLRRILADHFVTSMDVERSWHCDRVLTANPNDDHAKGFRLRQHGSRDERVKG